MTENERSFDRKALLPELFDLCDIPPKYFPLLTDAVLMLADTPEQSPEEVSAALALRMQKSERYVQMNLAQAVIKGWERAVSPASVLFRKRMSWQEYLEYAVTWLRGKDAAGRREQQRDSDPFPDGFRK